MDAVFREMGVSDPAVPKRMKTLYRSFAGRIDRLSETRWAGAGTRLRRRSREMSFPTIRRMSARAPSPAI